MALSRRKTAMMLAVTLVVVTLISLVALTYRSLWEFSTTESSRSDPTQESIRTGVGSGEESSRREEAPTTPDTRPAIDTTEPTVRSDNLFGRNEPSLEDFRPLDHYEMYLEAAEQGDFDAQYVLVTALAECRHLVRTEEALDDLALIGMPNDVLQAVNGRFNRCRPLFEVVPDLDAEYEQWMQAVRDAQHPVILARQPTESADEKKTLLMNAISAEYPESHLYADAFLEAAEYYSESQYPGVIDVWRQQAWLLLYCRVSFHCDSGKEREYLRTVAYPRAQYDQITSIEETLVAAIERGAWGELGFR